MEDGFRCGELKSESVGSIFQWNGKVEEEEWKKITMEDAKNKKSKENHVGKLYHALKF